MLGKLHFVTALIFFTPLAVVFFLGGAGTPAFLILFLAGLLLGVLLPDADHPAARGVGFITVPALAATRFLILFPLAGVLKLRGVSGASAHRAVMHSIWGAVAASVFWGACAALASLPFGLGLQYPLAFAVGIAAGFVFHLFQDSLTASGVRWLYPNGFLLRGRLSMQYAGLRQKRFVDSESYAGLLFAIAAIVNGCLAVSGVVPLMMALTAAFMLSLIAAACRMEADSY